MSTTPEERPNALSPTPTESFASVRVFWLNREKTLQRLQEAAKELLAHHSEIDEVILFGSLARGDAVPGSDADMLLILRESKLPFLERCVYYRPARVGIGVDIFAYTRRELQAMLEANNTFVARALHEGITLAKRDT